MADDETNIKRPEAMSKPKPGSSKEDNDAFNVDTALIPQASLDDQSAELKELGLSVFNQDVFEQGLLIGSVVHDNWQNRFKKIALFNKIEGLCNNEMNSSCSILGLCSDNILMFNTDGLLLS